jgi:hypothetical protein
VNARTLSLSSCVHHSALEICPPAPLMSTSTPSEFSSPTSYPIAPSPSLNTPFHFASAALEGYPVCSEVRLVTMVRSSGVATPIRNGDISMNITSMARICCCCCTSAGFTLMSLPLLRLPLQRWYVFPHITSGTLNLLRGDLSYSRCSRCRLRRSLMEIPSSPACPWQLSAAPPLVY